MARKVLLSFLGTNNYQDCNYYIEGQPYRKVENVKYIQEALVQLYCQDFTQEDKVILFVTEKAETMNYFDNGQYNKETQKLDLLNVGLESKLKTLNTQGCLFDLEPVRIREGFSQEEVWSIFESVAEKIQEEDEIILDITHAFRFLPMLGIVLLNYLKTTKNISVRGIHYGAFEKLGTQAEVANLHDSDKNAPIINLNTLLEFQSWTSAVNSFVKFGETSDLHKLGVSEISKILKDSLGKDQESQDLKFIINEIAGLTADLQTNRLNILLNKDLSYFSEILIKFHDRSTVIKPFKQILKLLENKTEGLLNKSKYRWLESAKWCNNHNLIQQAFTQVQEGLITHFIQGVNNLIQSMPQVAKFYHTDSQGSVDYLSKNSREYYGSLAYLIYKKKQDKELIIPSEFVEAVNCSMNNQLTPLAIILGQLNDSRNDINHAGMRPQPSDAKKLRNKINNVIKEIENLVYNQTDLKINEEVKKGFINLSNHPSAAWPPNQLASASQWGEVKDLPFPQIDPNSQQDDIEELAYKFLLQILELKPAAVHLMGELTFTFALVHLLKSHGITVLASTTHRTTEDLPDGSKVSKFEFVRFRHYWP